ncbi:hypothetical protein CRE_09811 [Caenorhabditis remanei]|uniref:Sdz-33 F-box domain-containing protein n=1 Tax=Caenorhabditis remanei TaxID=31234 RepID=E3NDE8_CAERE|nr:hypothetical protein CRE_09811 [Caenorhabditis remanei]
MTFSIYHGPPILPWASDSATGLLFFYGPPILPWASDFFTGLRFCHGPPILPWASDSAMGLRFCHGPPILPWASDFFMGLRFWNRAQILIGKELEVTVVGPKYMTQCFYIITSKEEKSGKVAENIWNDWKQLLVWKYSNNLVEEWKQLCIYVLEIFKKQTIRVFSIALDVYVDQNVSIIDFLKTNVKSVEKCHLYHLEEKNDVDEHAAYVLENIQITFELLLCLHIKSNDFILKIPKELMELTMIKSQWVGYDKLLEIDFKSVILKENEMSDEQWNLYFKKWITMETHLNLEHLELDYRDIEEFRALVLHDIPHEVVDRGVKRILKT